LCLRLFLLNPLHHFHSTCINRILFLVVQVDLILNSHLWICHNPIPKLQHALLASKCHKLGSVPQLFTFFIVSLQDPPLSLLRSLGVRHSSSCVFNSMNDTYWKNFATFITYSWDVEQTYDYCTVQGCQHMFVK
jgi:ABC-type phosphate/phosphonate transport system permease subunit